MKKTLLTTKEQTHLDYIKSRNLNKIINLIRQSQPISRAKVASALGLSKSAVSSLVDGLIEKKFVTEIGIGESTVQGGRRGVLLGFNPKARLCVGVSVTQDYITVMISDLDGVYEIYDRFEQTNQVERLIELIQGCICDHKINPEEIIAIGISVPGITKTREGIVVESPTIDWFDLELVKQMQEHFISPIYVLNDVDCLALGENWIGSAREEGITYFIGINKGLGSALIIDGELYMGRDSQSGEIGYTILDADNFTPHVNQLGKFGWLEESVSGWALEKTGYPLSQVFVEYRKGNERVVPVVERFIKNLSVMVANSIAMLNPDCVVIGGEVSEYMDEELKQIRDNVSAFVPIQAEIRRAKLGTSAFNLGAIAYTLVSVDLTK